MSCPSNQNKAVTSQLNLKSNYFNIGGLYIYVNVFGELVKNSRK